MSDIIYKPTNYSWRLLPYGGSASTMVGGENMKLKVTNRLSYKISIEQIEQF